MRSLSSIKSGQRRRARGDAPYLVVALLMLVVLVLTGCAKGSTDIVVSGSTTVEPIAEVAGEDYSKVHPEISVLVSGLGSSAGIEAVGLTKTADIGTSSRALKDDELNLGLEVIPIAHDGIAVVVNPANQVRNLQLDDLRDIFAGKITNWSEVGGADLPITLINRDESSGTRDAFTGKVMGTTEFDLNAVVLPGTGQVREVIRRTKGAIGYISEGFVNSQVRALSINGVTPSPANIASKKYPLSRDLFFLARRDISPEARGYIDYVLSDAIQEGAVREAGYLPVKIKAGDQK
ncbi:MAG: phosphate ABC transporter substrate-binding protein [Actinomycetia bacterium]|nr:phosphate ABC transporter substrate-binding protein [Actinomycetes bacterium]